MTPLPRYPADASPDPTAYDALVDVCGLDLTQSLLWTVPNFLAPDECRSLISRIEAAHPTLAPLSTARGPEFHPNVRNNSRVVFDDRLFAAALFARIAPHLPRRLLRMQLCGVNERFRCYRYQPGQRFALHSDGTFARSARERSLLTFLVYLNDGFCGGETAFPEQGQVIVPATGTALLFQHPLLHEGRRVESGVKYALRSDIMYRLPQ